MRRSGVVNLSLIREKNVTNTNAIGFFLQVSLIVHQMSDHSSEIEEIEK